MAFSLGDALAEQGELSVRPRTLPLWLALLRPAAGTPQSYLLLLRWALINVVGLALLVAVWLQGWIGMILAVDDTHICKLLFGLFVVGMIWSAQRALMLSRELNQLDRTVPDQGSRVGSYLRAITGHSGESRSALMEALRLRLASRLAPVRQMAATLVLVGLIGTIVGFIIALSGVDPTATTDASAIGPMIATLLRGMSMALFKTLVGSVLNIWLMVNHRLLEGGAVNLVARLIERGERA